MKKRLLLTSALLLLLFAGGKAQRSSIEKVNNSIQLYYDKEPFFILGGELGNSSASSVKDIRQIFPKLKAIGLNTVLVPVYWDLLEPQEGSFDFTLLDETLSEARKNDLRLVLLWFGAWKNSMSCYAPLWFKSDYKRFPRAYTSNGKPLEIASAFSDEILKADSKAFSRVISHIKEKDAQIGTVVMIQVENEIGMLESARDCSAIANKKFSQQVPEELITYLSKNKEKLHPVMLKRWQEAGPKKRGTWSEVFGEGIETDEIFMAYHYAKYVEVMTKGGKSIYNIPMYVNAAMNSRNRKPGEYPSAGPLAHLIDVWHCAAPSIDFLAPDLYDKGFKDWTAQYKLHNNPLFIPEIRLEDNDGVRACYVLGEMDGLGFSPFSIEDYNYSEKKPLVQSYKMLQDLMPLIKKYKGSDKMRGVLLDKEARTTTLKMEPKVELTCSHYFTLPWDPRAKEDNEWPEGGALLIRLSDMEYIIAGSGIVVTFQEDGSKTAMKVELGEDGFINNGGKKRDSEERWNKDYRIGIGYIDEVKMDKDGKIERIRRFNGDQDHQGRHARISVDDFKILHVKLYSYK